MTAVNLLSSLSASTLAHVQLVIHIEARDSFLIADFIKSHLTPSLSVDFLNLVLYDLSSYIINVLLTLFFVSLYLSHKTYIYFLESTLIPSPQDFLDVVFFTEFPPTPSNPLDSARYTAAGCVLSWHLVHLSQLDYVFFDMVV